MVLFLIHSQNIMVGNALTAAQVQRIETNQSFPHLFHINSCIKDVFIQHRFNRFN